VQQSFSEAFITPCNHIQFIQISHWHQTIQQVVLIQPATSSILIYLTFASPAVSSLAFFCGAQ